MPRQNRVMPTGEIIAHPAKGMFMGNRGELHDANGHLTHRRWTRKYWVTCTLAFKGIRRKPMQPGRYTELFFHDEAVAFAAGHRPCAECRRPQYDAFRTAAGITGSITGYDRVLHDARAIPRVYGQRRHRSDLAGLPDGAFVIDADGRPLLVLDDALYPFGPQGYGAPEPRPSSGLATVLTPEPLVRALQGGYRLALRLPG